MKRIQRQRTKGWRMPEGAVYVGRPSRWGNPYHFTRMALADDNEFVGPGVESVMRGYRKWLDRRLREDHSFLLPLWGHDLVCWCPLDQPCHADVLLELVNR